MSDDIKNNEYLDTPNDSCLSQVAGTLTAEPSQQPDLAKACTSINVDSSSTKKITLIRKTVSTLKSASRQDTKTINLQGRKKRTFIKTKLEQLIQPNLDIKPVPTVDTSTVIEPEVQLADVKDMDEPLDNSAQINLPGDATSECIGVLPSLPLEDKTPVRLIRMPELIRMISISRSSIYDRLDEDSPRHDPTFPRQKKKGRTALWKLSEVLVWMDSDSISGGV